MPTGDSFAVAAPSTVIFSMSFSMTFSVLLSIGLSEFFSTTTALNEESEKVEAIHIAVVITARIIVLPFFAACCVSCCACLYVLLCTFKNNLSGRTRA